MLSGFKPAIIIFCLQKNLLRIFDKTRTGSLAVENVQAILTEIGDEAISEEEALSFIEFAKAQTGSDQIQIDDLIKILLSS